MKYKCEEQFQPAKELVQCRPLVNIPGSMVVSKAGIS